MAVRQAVNAQLRVDVPGLGTATVDNVLIHVPPDAAGVSPNALVWGPGQVDAAPCGSGTCARMALLHHRGRMQVGDTMISRGLLGLDFTGRIAGETRSRPARHPAGDHRHVAPHRIQPVPLRSGRPASAPGYSSADP